MQLGLHDELYRRESQQQRPASAFDPSSESVGEGAEIDLLPEVTDAGARREAQALKVVGGELHIRARLGPIDHGHSHVAALQRPDPDLLAARRPGVAARARFEDQGCDALLRAVVPQDVPLAPEVVLVDRDGFVVAVGLHVMRRQRRDVGAQDKRRSHDAPQIELGPRLLRGQVHPRALRGPDEAIGVVPSTGTSISAEPAVDGHGVPQLGVAVDIAGEAPRVPQGGTDLGIPRRPTAEREEDLPAGAVEHVAEVHVLLDRGLRVVRGVA
mmetsp:Transcript_95477/g.275680  ORF Transcript_95477/g.275680 Transcript_95477/m.275680 type:complete len:270 (+) Transcript_95477:41-850(+)